MSSSGSNLENYLIPLEEINRATQNFSKERCIGAGGFGRVYKGQLSEPWQHRTAAIKRRDRDSYQGEREFRDELEMISRFHHENIISFLGYCDQGNEMILVYDYAVNGSLDCHLGDPDKMCCITWTQRLKICIGAAKGLNYLHSGLGEHNRVIHRDIKSANILLGDNLIAKICDFGLSKSGARNQPDTQLHTRVAGTQFYMDPSYHESRILHKESDVYSFGVVLFEILSGTLVYHLSKIEDDERQFLMTVVRQYYDKPEKLIDPHIRLEIDGPSFDMFKEVAYQCISLDSLERPTMDEVVERIEEALTIQTSVQSKIRSLVRKLYSVVPTDQWAALSEIFHLANTNDLLTTPDSQTREYGVTTLGGLSTSEEITGSIVSSGAVPGIIHVLSQGTMEAREIAAGTLKLLSENEENWETISVSVAGAIPPLVLLLSHGTRRGKEHAVDALMLLCMHEGNIGLAMRAGVVPIFLELLIEPEGGLKDKVLFALGFLSYHREGRLAICKADAVPVLVELIWSGSPENKDKAASILKKLCSEDEKCLVEGRELRECVLRKLDSIIPTDQRTALSEILILASDNNSINLDIGEAGVIPLITDLLLTASDSLTQEHAMTALYILSIFEVNIVSSEAVPGIIHVLSQGSRKAQEKAAAILTTLSEIEENRVTIGDAGAIPPLVLLLSEAATQTGKKVAADALGFLCYYEGNIGRAVRAGVVPILMDLLNEQEDDLKDETIAILAFLSIYPEGRLAIGEVEAMPVLVELIGTGSLRNKERVTAILMELCSEDQKYLVEAQELGVMEKLMDLEQHGTDSGKRTAGQLLEKIRQAQRQTVAAEHGLGIMLLEKIIQICSLRF